NCQRKSARPLRCHSKRREDLTYFSEFGEEEELSERKINLSRNVSSCALFHRREFGFQWPTFSKTADAEDTKPQHTSLFIYTLHHSIMSSRTHEARCLAELHLQVIAFRVKPDFYFFGHMVSPDLSWSVKYAVTTKASSGGYFTTT